MFVDKTDKIVYGNGSYIGVKLQLHDISVFHSYGYDRILDHNLLPFLLKMI